MTWKIGNRRIIGKSHLETGLENQDSCFIFEKENLTFFIVCDGAGSARFGAQGAKTLVTHLYKNIADSDIFSCTELETQCISLEEAVKNTIWTLHKQIREGHHRPKAKKLLKIIRSIFGQEQEDKNSIDEYAATLLVAAIAKNHVSMCHIGDGYMAGGTFGEGGKFTQTVFSFPENGEYDNQTHFFTDSNWEEHLRVAGFKEQLDFFVAMTDGADPFLILGDRLNLDAALVERIAELSRKHSQLELSEILNKLFPDEKVHSVSSDDTTFCVLLRDEP